jgi:hypothetical protein
MRTPTIGNMSPRTFLLAPLDPFVITWRTSLDDVEKAFVRWLDAALAVAIKEYGDRI